MSVGSPYSRLPICLVTVILQLAACLFICCLVYSSPFLQNVGKLTILHRIVSQKIVLFIVTSVIFSNLATAMLFRALTVWVSARIGWLEFLRDLSENIIFFAIRNIYTKVISDELRTPKVGGGGASYMCV
jgi:hypothetical protein